ncbi:MAG TPA: Fur family transcriptional regulator [Geobacteraceae bacterium]|nr:Fur family transcriptional regulator [Geobacteraceae bacterium]
MKDLIPSEEIKSRLIAGLKAKGYKLTSQRLEILDFLSKDATHPGVMDIVAQVRKKVPKISLSTVYYNMDILKKEGLIREIEFYDRDNRYDVNVSNHLNLICKQCGKIEDFMMTVPVPPKVIEHKTGFKPSHMRFEYYGFCRDCRNKKKKG